MLSTLTVLKSLLSLALEFVSQKLKRLKGGCSLKNDDVRTNIQSITQA